MRSQLLGLTALTSRLEEIRHTCGGATDEDGRNGSKDDFVMMKQRLLHLLHLTRTSMRERGRLLKRTGNSHQVIERAVRIREMIQQIESCLPELARLQIKGGGKLGRAENEARLDDIRTLTRQVEEAKSALRSRGGVDEDEENALWNGEGKGDPNSAFRAQLGKIKVDRSGRELDEREGEALERWEKRDEEFESMLDQIGVMCDRLNPMVQEIGMAAQRQTLMAADLGKKVRNPHLEKSS